MHYSKQHEEVATGIHERPAQLQSFLEASARHFGLADVPSELLRRRAAPTCKVSDTGSKSINKQNVTHRGAA